MSEKVMHFSSSNFDGEVMKSEMPVLVDFWAEWCSPCRMLAPTVDVIASDYEGKVKVGKVNVDENSAIAEQYGIMSIPTVILFVNGKPAEKSVGLVSKTLLTNMLDKYV
jgi:thioredoxin 1